VVIGLFRGKRHVRATCKAFAALVGAIELPPVKVFYRIVEILEGE